MVSYNDITKLTFFYENKQHNKILDYIINLCKSSNIIDILNFIKTERYQEETSNIKINYDNKELVVLQENFLVDIPEKKTSTVTLGDFEYEISYPDIIDHNISTVYCIKKVNYCGEEHYLTTQEDYNLIPARVFNELKEHIDPYIKSLTKILVYKVGHIESRFFIDRALIINIVYLAFVELYKNIIQEQLFLMKEYNFTYESFDRLSFHEIKHYLKAGIKNINERNNSET